LPLSETRRSFRKSTTARTRTGFGYRQKRQQVEQRHEDVDEQEIDEGGEQEGGGNCRCL
jgi:hypothetical protein